ncbi:hypothetical protein [Mycobacteroides abscessus]|uniref:hypothetical protein n=1 Tax=Mycobacteroides abscessus TaxID=36809 RepID=UPI0005DEE14D|nr:hypothetical protein [Mycobacteroides abscessus]CPS10273.1 Uncharacterised protein [Mycobacteroides abscessus]CPS26430.1 Uncharacterised protein [Mycobacteroides abscessus]CPS28959.1 Uncharacterised protein [Mycobacteroides abscessus]CPT09806.1 Uncharacterised protein [Mycobacteroides abscessus]CPT29393.1 Uncharacterised protein [Mycobacteroides abscessus]
MSEATDPFDLLVENLLKRDPTTFTNEQMIACVQAVADMRSAKALVETTEVLKKLMAANSDNALLIGTCLTNLRVTTECQTDALKRALGEHTDAVVQAMYANTNMGIEARSVPTNRFQF